MKKKLNCKNCNCDFIHDFTYVTSAISINLNIESKQLVDENVPIVFCDNCNSTYVWTPVLKSKKAYCSWCGAIFTFPEKEPKYIAKDHVKKIGYDSVLIHDTFFDYKNIYYGREYAIFVDNSSSFYAKSLFNTGGIDKNFRLYLRQWETLHYENSTIKSIEISINHKDQKEKAVIENLVINDIVEEDEIVLINDTDKNRTFKIDKQFGQIGNLSMSFSLTIDKIEDI